MTLERADRVNTDFDTMVDTHSVRLVRLAAFLGADDAEDVVQEAFTRLYERRRSFKGDLGQAGGWLSRTVVNLVRDRHRRSIVHRRFGRLHSREAELHVPSAEAMSEASAQGRLLMAALGHLPRRRREAVVLRYWLDLPYAEIADVMGTTVGSAKSAVSRGLDDLHHHLTRETETS